MMQENDQSIQLATLDYLFRIQQILCGTKQHLPNYHYDHVAAYIGWHLNNRLTEYQNDIGTLKKAHPENLSNFSELTHLCINCYSVLSKFRFIPRLKLHKKKGKVSKNHDFTIVNGKCKFCKSRFKFKIFKKLCGSSFVQNQPPFENFALDKNTTTPKQSSSKSQKEVLQKLLQQSKKKRNLDNKTKLTHFLNKCFS